MTLKAHRGRCARCGHDHSATTPHPIDLHQAPAMEASRMRKLMALVDDLAEAGFVGASSHHNAAVTAAREALRATLATPIAPAAGSEQSVPAGWMPIESAPEGVRVLLGPRDAPVVGKVDHPAAWEEGETSCHVVHYNGTVLVAGYHCKEWHTLPKPPATPGEAS